MDKSALELEVEDILRVNQQSLEDKDDTTKEYTISINNVSKLHQILTNERDYELKKEKNLVENNIAKRKMTLAERQFDADQRNKVADRKIEEKKLDQQHAERMAELRVNQTKADNEKTILEQNQVKSKREFIFNIVKEVGKTVGKVACGIALLGFSIWVYKDESKFEREENGISTPRMKNSESTLRDMMKSAIK